MLFKEFLRLGTNITDWRVRNRIDKFVLPHFESILAPQGYKVSVGETELYETHSIVFGTPSEEVAVFDYHENLLVLRIRSHAVQDFKQRVLELYKITDTVAPNDPPELCIPIYATKGSQTALIYLASATTTKPEFNPIFKLALPTPSLVWMLSPLDRVHHLVESWSEPTHQASALTAIDHNVIRAYVVKWSSLHNLKAKEAITLIMRDVLKVHLDKLRTNLALSPEGQFHTARYTFGANADTVMDENKTFVANISSFLLERLYLSFQTLNAQAVDWDSLKKELRLLGQGKNGAYGNSLNHFQDTQVSFTNHHGLIQMQADQSYLHERRKNAREHNHNINFFADFRAQFMDFSPSMHIFQSINNDIQGYCPVSSHNGAEKLHTFDWIVDLMKATLEDYLAQQSRES
jgi:hypothetical protein